MKNTINGLGKDLKVVKAWLKDPVIKFCIDTKLWNRKGYKDQINHEEWLPEQDPELTHDIENDAQAVIFRSVELEQEGKVTRLDDNDIATRPDNDKYNEVMEKADEYYSKGEHQNG